MILKTTTSKWPIFIQDTSNLASHAYTLEASEFVLGLLFKGNENKIDGIGRVEIYFSPDIRKTLGRKFKSDPDLNGITIPQDGKNGKVDFKIWISEHETLKEQTVTLFHELVHVYQEIVVLPKLTEQQEDDLEDAYYEADPFENEAFSKEEVLYNEWIAYKKKE